MTTITVTPDQHEQQIVAWITDTTGLCSRLEIRPAGPVPDYDPDGNMSITFTTPTISCWLAVHARGCFARGKRPLTFACDKTGRNFHLKS